MVELGSFEKGIVVERTCPKGIKARLYLYWLDEMRREQREEYIAVSSTECQICPLKTDGSCTGLNGSGIAQISGVNETARELLEHFQTPCSQSKIIGN